MTDLARVELVLKVNESIFPQLRNRYTEEIYLPAQSIPRVGDTISLYPKNENPNLRQEIGIKVLKFLVVKKVTIHYSNSKEDNYSLSSYEIELGVEPGRNIF